MLKQIKKPKVSKVGATQYYHFLFCIGKRGATRSVENPFGFWIRWGECISVAPSARPHFGSKIRFRFLAVSIVQNSNLFWKQSRLIARAKRVVTLTKIVRSTKAPPPPRFTRQPQKEKMFLTLLIFAGWIFSKMERTFFFLGFCPPSIRAVWRGFNSDFGKAENLFFWGKGFFRFASGCFCF